MLAGRIISALGGTTVPDPSDGTVPCLALHDLEALYAPLLGLDSLSEQHSFTRPSVSPAALARAKEAAATAGLDFSPAMLEEFAARVRALRVLRSPALLLGDDDFVASETPVAVPLFRHRYVLGIADTSLDAVDGGPRRRRGQARAVRRSRAHERAALHRAHARVAAEGRPALAPHRLRLATG